MSVTMMVGSEKAGQPNVKKINWPGVKDPLYVETTYVGLVLAVGEHNGYDDSDFYATVWNPVTSRPFDIEYGTTRAWTYPNHAEVDASAEVRAAYDEYRRVEADKAVAEYAKVEAAKPAKGKKVRVVRGRKVPIGTEGVIFWMDESRAYSPSKWAVKSVKVGIALDDVKDAKGHYVNVAWTYAENVEVVA